jgi:hypothetical protein
MNRADLERRLAGTFTMVSMSTHFKGGDPEQHEGSNGRLSYNWDLKTVFAEISRPDNRQPSGYLKFQYAGTYEIVNDHEIIHHIQWATNPDMIGKDMKREFRLTDDGLEIIGDSAEYEDATINITWQKQLGSDNAPALHHYTIQL